MSERLPELLRQRALIQEHLAWLDHEIATAQGLPTPQRPFATTNPSTGSPRAIISSTPATNSKTEAEAEKIIGQFLRDPNALKTDTKRGCLMAFAIGFGLFAVAVFIGYWLYARHLGRWW